MELNNTYGLAPMTFEEEWNASEAVKKKRNAKVNIANWCELMKRDINQIANTARNIPETNDDRHAQLIQNWAREIKLVLNTLDWVASGRFPEPVCYDAYARVQFENDIQETKLVAERTGVVLTNEEISEIAIEFRENHDCMTSDYDQLQNLILFKRREN